MTVVAFHTTLSVPEVLGAEAVAVVSYPRTSLPKSCFIYHSPIIFFLPFMFEIRNSSLMFLVWDIISYYYIISYFIRNEMYVFYSV